MRRVLIAGFFDFVEEAVRSEFGAALERGDVVVVGLGRGDPRRGLNVPLFKGALARAVEGCTELLVVLGVSDAAPWVKESVDAILAGYADRCQIDLETRRDLRSSAPILERLKQCDLDVSSPANQVGLLAERLRGQRVFCARSTTMPSFERVLPRIGFVFDPVYFSEEAFEPSKNSNLIQNLTRKADQYDWLLYAWVGLRTMPPDVKRKFRRGCLEGDSPMKVCLMFRKQLLGG